MQATQEIPGTTTAIDHHLIGAPEALAHRQRCRSLPPLRPGEAENLLADFLATRGVTVCPTRYVAPIERRPLLVRAGY